MAVIDLPFASLDRLFLQASLDGIGEARDQTDGGQE